MNTLLYDGKAKEIYATENENNVIMFYKDDTKAYNGIKKAKINNKGVINNKISSLIFEHLNESGIRTHFIKRIDDRNQLCEKVAVIPLEVICRNVACGSVCRRYGYDEGRVFKAEIMDYCYKNDDLDDPYINFDTAVELGLADKTTLKYIDVTARKINRILFEFFDKIDIILVDFKMEFGINASGEVLLCDEISPDTARLWDKESKEKLDKDRFRRDMGKIEEAYFEILKRLNK
ncbi:MAG: phosphoribosylaminoimidazolesuccinocarboxamide synthase [Clostridia bacterium]